MGPIVVGATNTVAADNSIIDATSAELPAFSAGGRTGGGILALDACTVIGTVDAHAFGTVSNSILLARSIAADGTAAPPVTAERRQTGCMRFSYVPLNSRVPRRYLCQPTAADQVSETAPRFVSVRYGTPAYCELDRATTDLIRRGADDESEMGAFHGVFAPQREAGLVRRLAEYLRVGLAAGVFYAT